MRIDVYKQEYVPYSTKAYSEDQSNETAKMVDLISRNAKVRKCLNAIQVDEFDRLLLSTQVYFKNFISINVFMKNYNKSMKNN